jgi:EXPERA (EXPanded EBP superfamily)
MSREASARLPIHRRPFDLALALFFSVSVLYGFLFSLPEGIGVPVAPDSPWPPLRSLYEWAVAQEPAHLDPPPNLIAACLFDGFFQAPALLFVIAGLVRLASWLRPLGLVYAGAAVTNMFFYFVQTFLGPHPPLNTVYYLVFNLPWLIAPALLGARVQWARDLGSRRA